jgi:hypothetical protein
MAKPPNINMQMAGASIPQALQFRDVNRTKLFSVFMVFSFGEADGRCEKHEPAVSAAVPAWPARLIVASLTGLTGKSRREG